MRRKSFLRCLFWLACLCVIALGYVFYKFHTKTSSLQQLTTSNPTEEDTIFDNSPTIFSTQAITHVPSSSQTPAEVQSSSQTPTDAPTSSQTPARSPRRSLLIFGHDRSGTTFISAMFAKDPQIFMVYEPLWITQRWKYYEPDYHCSKCELQLVSSIVACNFTRSAVSTKFLSYVSAPWTGALPVNIFNTPNFCNKSKELKSEEHCPELGKNPEFVDDVCFTKFKHSVVKVAPARLPGEKLANLVPQVLLENLDIDIRVLHIARDPRGNINSRIDIGWMKDYPNPYLARTARKLCNTIVANLDHAAKTLTELKLKHKYKLVLYKQIADDPLGTVKDIYKFAGFEMPSDMEMWIVGSTTPNEKKLKEALKHPYSTVRNATGNADKWHQEAFSKRNRVIETECKPLMDILGLERVSKPEGSASGEHI